MKRFLTNTLLIVSVLLIANSCQKNQPLTITKAVTVDLKMNEVYSYPLPNGDAPEITGQAQHSSVVSINTDAQGNKTFVYVPSTNFTGTDEAQVYVSGADANNLDPNSSSTTHPSCGNGGGCSGGFQQNNQCGSSHASVNRVNVTYIFKINVSDNTKKPL